MKKSFLAGMLTIVLVVSLIPTTVSAKTDGALQVKTQVGEQETIITPVISGSVDIKSGGIYVLKGGNYTTDDIPIVINTTDPVTLKIEGDIRVDGSENFIMIKKPCDKLIIDGNDHVIQQEKEEASILSNQAKANVILKGGTYECETDSVAMMYNTYGGIVSIYDSVLRQIAPKGKGVIFHNDDSILNIYSGMIEGGKVSDFFCIYGGTVNIYGGSISSGSMYSTAIRAKDVKFMGGEIVNSGRGIELWDSRVMIGDNALFKNNSTDIKIYNKDCFSILKKGDSYIDSEGNRHVVSKNWSNCAKVRVDDSMDVNTKYPITTNGTSEDMIQKISCLNDGCSVKYDQSEKYLYLWKHKHTWSYAADGNTITAKCTSDPECTYIGGLTATITAKDMVFNARKYNQLVRVKNNISDVTGDKATISYVGRDGTDYEENTEEPSSAGKYKAKLTIAGKTATADYEIFKADQESPQIISTDETIKGKKDGTISNVDSKMEYSMDGISYEDITDTQLTGLQPGVYYVRYKETKNYNASNPVRIEIREGITQTVVVPKPSKPEVQKVTDIGLKVTQSGNKLKISYNKLKNASEYDIYVQNCQNKFTKKSLIQVKNGKTSSVTVKKVNGKKLNPKNNFKVYVVAYQNVNGKKVTLAKSITAHVAGSKNKKRTNVKRVKVSKASYTLKKGKTAKIKAKAVLVNPKKKQLGNDHAKQFRYVTSNSKIATVSKTGKIKAAGKGTCDIYVYARNGCAKKVKVTVK